MRHIKNMYYKVREMLALLMGDYVSADYYAAKREGA